MSNTLTQEQQVILELNREIKQIKSDMAANFNFLCDDIQKLEKMLFSIKANLEQEKDA